MIASCEHLHSKKNGRNRNGSQRYKCLDCGAGFSDDFVPPGPIGTMRVDTDRAMTVLNMLLEGLSIRSAERLTGMCRDTICDLILVAGDRCRQFHNRRVINVTVNDLQIDELWSFVNCKAKIAKRNGYGPERGDSWTFVAIERETKLVLAHHVGQRDSKSADQFMAKVRHAVNDDHRYQVTTDGLQAYQYSVPFGLGSNIDYGMLIKSYAAQQEVTRYSPAQIIRAEKVPQFGQPDHPRICTSHIERFNLTMRMQLRRFTRLTNAFSKSLQHHCAMQSLMFTWYNWCRRHSTIKQTPAMASGLADRPWKLREVLEG